MWSGRFKCQLVLTVNGCGNSLGFLCFFFFVFFFLHTGIFTGFTNTCYLNQEIMIISCVPVVNTSVTFQLFKIQT